MLKELQYTTVRERMKETFDSVYIERRPAIVRRNRTEDVAMISRDMLNSLISSLKIEYTIHFENDLYVAWSESINQYGSGPTEKEALDDLIDSIMEYAEIYYEKVSLYLAAPNTKLQFPLIFRVWLCDSKEEVLDLLEVQNAS